MFFSDLLSALGVRHTAEYSDKRFMSMPFMSMFGMQGLLREYGVATKAISLDDRGGLAKLPVPFVAPVKAHEWVIVTKVGNNGVDYTNQGQRERADIDTFNEAWTGVALLMNADKESLEPDYAKHRFKEIMVELRNSALWVLTAVLAIYMFISGGLYKHVWAYFAVLFYCQGLAASFMLVQKTVGIHTKAAENVCGAIEKGGCDHVIDTGGTFLGIFHWSEVGLTYFSVSLLFFLALPSTIPWLALFNCFCLPYTVWSVYYQHFKAHAWCTLCLTVQATFWILFITYLFSGWWHGLTLTVTPVLMAALYIIVCLGINRLMPYINAKKS